MNIKNPLLPRLLLLLFPLAIVVIAVISFFNNSQPVLPTVIQTSPPNNSQEASIFSPVLITPSSPLDPSLISVSSTPPEIWSVSISGGSLALDHKEYLHADTDYLVEISYDNQPFYSLSFHTIKQQGDIRYTQESIDTLLQDYPLATSFPYETSTFRVVYSAPMTLEITLKSNSLTEEEAISQLKTWITQNGGDPATHSYQVILAPQE